MNHGINGSVLTVIKNIYAEAKSCVKSDDEYSEFFTSNVGVRQGENLSPILFAIFLNDMKDHLAHDMTGLITIANEAKAMNLSENDINVFLKLFVLLYADDTVIFSETAAGLQKGLSAMKLYCDRWKLKLNVKKCKVIIFSRGKVRKVPDFHIGNDKIDVVSDFTYLGLKLNYNNRMHVAQKDLLDRATRAMYALLRKCNVLMLPIDLIIDLFDKTVLPVMTYGCEIWGFDINEALLRLQLKFYKQVLKLRQSTPSLMIFGEIGKFPVTVSVKSRMLSFWLKLVTAQNGNTLSALVYRFLLSMYLSETYENKYLACIKTTLNEIGLSNMWLNQHNLDVNVTWFKEKVKRCLKDQYMQNWYMHVDNDEVFINYRMFKPTFGPDPFVAMLPNNCVISLMKFRTTNNILPVNRQRYEGIPRNERLCDKCNLHDVADEFHYLFVCPFFSKIRNECIPKYFITHPNTVKYNHLLSAKNKHLLLKLKKFITVLSNELR